MMGSEIMTVEAMNMPHLLPPSWLTRKRRPIWRVRISRLLVIMRGQR